MRILQESLVDDFKQTAESTIAPTPGARKQRSHISSHIGNRPNWIYWDICDFIGFCMRELDFNVLSFLLSEGEATYLPRQARDRTKHETKN